MPNRKGILYREARAIARTLNIPSPIWTGSTISSLQRFIEENRRPIRQNLPFLEQVRNYIRDIKTMRLRNQTVEQFIQQVRNLLQPNKTYYYTIKTDSGDNIRLRRGRTITSTSSVSPFYDLYTMLIAIMQNSEEYDVSSDYIDIQFHQQVVVNPPLRNQRNGDINCACKAVLDHLNETPSKRNDYRIKNVMKINDKYLSSGIDEEGLQQLANKSQIKLVIKDKSKEIWNEFIPKISKNHKTLLLVSHNNHISNEEEPEPFDEDDEDDEPNNASPFKEDLEVAANYLQIQLPIQDQFQSIEIHTKNWVESDQQEQNEIKWFDDSDDVVKKANDYENEGMIGTPIISKGKLVAYITPDVIWKTKFHEYEKYPNSFTHGGVGKSKFIEQHPEYKYGINDSDPFYSLLMDADRSGFYSRTGESKKENTKYDQNKAYKSFSKSGLFQGFPILEATFKIEKKFSEIYEMDDFYASSYGLPHEIIQFRATDDMEHSDISKEAELDDDVIKGKFDYDEDLVIQDQDQDDEDSFNFDTLLDEIHADQMVEVNKRVRKDAKLYNQYPEAPLQSSNFKHGLLYVEWETLTKDKLHEKIYYETSGWYPVEIVKEYYNQYGIDPYIKSYAYASETFDVDFQKFTNDQFRTFLGKCSSRKFDECWRTKDYLEYMRARYVLKDRITSFKYSDGFYNITYTSDKKPWNMPVISAYVKAHQKFNLFQQYNKLIENAIVPIAVSVDGIEVVQKCDHLFDIGKNNGQWKHESVYTGGSTEPSVIERTIPPTRGQLEFSRDLILSKHTHICGPGGNGKSEFIVNLAKTYPSMAFCGPTHGAVKNLIERGDQLGVKITAATYHRVFGINCRDTFQRDRYTHFVIDECSMLPAVILREIINKLNPTQKLIIAGDFWQLPCVSQTPIFDNWTGKASVEYEMFEKRELTKNWRQKEDPEFFDLCNKLRDSLTKKEAMGILKILNERVVPKDKLPDFDSLDDIYICGINEQVDLINKKYKFEVGSKVISNMTCKDLAGNTVANGDIGIVLSISPLRINFSTDDKSEVSTFRNVGKNKSGKPRFSPSYALTVHKAQGRTITRNVVINPSRLFAKNHLYVALTRATKFSSIYLTEPMKFSTFCKTVNVV